MQHIIRLTTKL